MSDEPESIAAILAEMRRANFQPQFYQRCVNEYADRIEAAAARERDEDRQLAAIAESDEAFARCERRDRPERAPGNAAAMREALESAHRTLKLVCEHAGEFVQPRLAEEIIHTGAAVERALAAPARNCDRFDECHDAVDAWHREERCFGRHKDGGTCKKDPLASTLAPVCFARWLFAPALGGAK